MQALAGFRSGPLCRGSLSMDAWRLGSFPGSDHVFTSQAGRSFCLCVLAARDTFLGTVRAVGNRRSATAGTDVGVETFHLSDAE
jgi:hypothetical protein